MLTIAFLQHWSRPEIIQRPNMRSAIQLCSLIFSLALVLQVICYEKTLRKIVRDNSKMVQRPFSETVSGLKGQNLFGQAKAFVQKLQRPKISTFLSTLDLNKTKCKSPLDPNEIKEARLIRHTSSNAPQSNTFAKEIYYQIPRSRFFPNDEEERSKNNDQINEKDKHTPEILPDNIVNNANKSIVNKLILKKEKVPNDISVPQNLDKPHIVHDTSMEKVDFFIEEIKLNPNITTCNSNRGPIVYDCADFPESEAEIDVQVLLSKLDIEPVWAAKKKYWNELYNARYESLMKNDRWPPLKVIMIPRTHVDSIWKQSFDQLHNTTVRHIISNVVKKLQFYKNLTFTWNEVSHLSKWWSTASSKNRAALRRIIKEERFEITTGGWVETDESTSHIFGLLHQFIEGHQWLKDNLDYFPEVAWLTNSVTHSPTVPYILSASGIYNLIITNLHFSLEQYFAEYQRSDFVWIQNWDRDKTSQTKLNYALNKIGNDKYPEHSVFTHYMQFNSADFNACGPTSEICQREFDFENSNKNMINAYNIKDKSELLLEQYSKTGTLSPHNVIIAPLGGTYHYQKQKAFDFQYNSYWKIADFVNFNQDIYKATLQFGTPKDYFASILSIHKKYPTLKGDFNNFADVVSGTPAYWTGFFTTRPTLKLLLRYLQSNLRSAEILYSFGHSYDVFETHDTKDLFKRLLNAREIVARLQDRNVVSGTLTAKAVRYVHTQIVNTIKNCWYIQETAASFLSTKPGQKNFYLEKYVYRDGDFLFSFKSIISGDQIYIFNSLSHERTEVVELTARSSNIRVLDHTEKDVLVQVNPVWQYTSDNTISISRQFYKIFFVATLPPFSFALFKIKETYDTTEKMSTIYCVECSVESVNGISNFPFSIHPIERGDIQVENYKHRLIIDEFTGFLKTVIDKTTGREKIMMIDYGAFRSSYKNSGIFLFGTNNTRPFQDILLPYRLGTKNKIMIIISGQVVTEVTSIYGKLLQHTIKIFNVMNSPLKNVLKIESKVEYDVSPNHREMEIFLSLQTDIANGETPKIYVDNNGFQYTPQYINISRRIESNIFPITSIAYIQDRKSRITVVTDHAQGVTALQEGQLVVILDRRVLYNDGRGTGEGIADNGAMTHTHILLFEDFHGVELDSNEAFSLPYVQLPSISANYFANAMNYPLDVYFISKNLTHMCYYAFFPLVKTSFPCDVNVINYRISVNNDYTDRFLPSTALVTLHRQSFSCYIPLQDNFNCFGDSTFNLFKIFGNIREVYKTNLVGTNKGVPKKIFDLTSFKPMELMTLRVYF